MLCLCTKDLQRILNGFGVKVEINSFSELQRDASDAKQIRLIVKVCFKDAPLEQIESQCRFANALRDNGIPTPRPLRCGEYFAHRTIVDGCGVTATVEQFVPRELQYVDEDVAEKTGALLA